MKARCPNCGWQYKIKAIGASCSQCLMQFGKVMKLEPVWLSKRKKGLTNS